VCVCVCGVCVYLLLTFQALRHSARIHTARTLSQDKLARTILLGQDLLCVGPVFVCVCDGGAVVVVLLVPVVLSRRQASPPSLAASPNPFSLFRFLLVFYMKTLQHTNLHI